MNRVELTGNLTRDVKITTTDSGARFAEFTLAVADVAYDAEQRTSVIVTTYVSVHVSGMLATLLTEEPLGKGSEVYVVGRLEQREVHRREGPPDRKTRVAAVAVTIVRYRRPAAPDQPAPPPPADPWT